MSQVTADWEQLDAAASQLRALVTEVETSSTSARAIAGEIESAWTDTKGTEVKESVEAIAAALDGLAEKIGGRAGYLDRKVGQLKAVHDQN